MIYLNKKQLIPALLLINIIFIPLIVTLLTFGLTKSRYEPLIVLAILVLIWLFSIFFVIHVSKSKTYYLIIKDWGLEIYCNNKYCNNGLWILPYNLIKQFDYYRMNSLKGWFILYTYLLPKCVFITIYDKYDKEESVFIGYMDLEQIKSIAEKGRIKLILH